MLSLRVVNAEVSNPQPWSSLRCIASRAVTAETGTAWPAACRPPLPPQGLGRSVRILWAACDVGCTELARGHADGREKLLRALELAKQAGLSAEVGRVYINLLDALSRSHQWAGAGETIEAGIEWCRRHGLDAWLGYVVAAQAEWHEANGRWDYAAETALSILNGPPSQVVGFRNWALCTLARVRVRRGDPGYWPLLDEALESARAVGELQHLAPVAAIRAEAAWLEGRSDAIGAETDDAFALALRQRAPRFVGELACWRWRGWC